MPMNYWKKGRLPIHMMHEYLENTLPWIPEDKVLSDFTPQHNSEFAQFELGIFKAAACVVGKVAVAMKRRRARAQQQPAAKALGASGLKILWADLDEELEDVNDLFKPLAPLPTAVPFVPRGWKPEPVALTSSQENAAAISIPDPDATPRQAWYMRMPPPPVPEQILELSVPACARPANCTPSLSTSEDDRAHPPPSSPPSVNFPGLDIVRTEDVLTEDGCAMASFSPESSTCSSESGSEGDYDGTDDEEEETQETDGKIERQLRASFSVRPASVLSPVLSLDCYDPAYDADNEGSGAQSDRVSLLGEVHEKDQDGATTADFKFCELTPFSWSFLPPHLQDPSTLFALDTSSAERSHLEPLEVADVGVASPPSAHTLQPSISDISLMAVRSSPVLPPAYEKYEGATLHKREPCQFEDDVTFVWDALPPYLAGPTTFQPFVLPEPTLSNPNPFEATYIGYPSPPIDRDFELQWSLSELSLAAVASPPAPSSSFAPSASELDWSLMSSTGAVEDEKDGGRIAWAAETELQAMLLRDWERKFDAAPVIRPGTVGRAVAVLRTGVHRLLGRRRG